MSPLRFPQKHSRSARLERFALLLVSSPHYARFIVHRTRSQLRPLRNIVALLTWSASHCSLFLHLIMLASSSTGCARNFAQLRYTPIDIIFNCVMLVSLHIWVRCASLRNIVVWLFLKTALCRAQHTDRLYNNAIGMSISSLKNLPTSFVEAWNKLFPDFVLKNNQKYSI